MNQHSKLINITLSTDRRERRSPSLLRSTGIFVWRSLQHTKNNYFSVVMDAVMGPVLMLLIFTYLFGGAIAGSTKEYVQFLLPGMFILAIVPMTVYSGTAICDDISKGVYNRFRTMPFWQPSAILGPLITDSLRIALALLVAFATGILIGFRPEGGVVGAILGILFTMLFAFSLNWVFMLIGILAKRPETVSGTSMIFIYPLLFASNILVDPTTMPRWIQILVDLNPISITSATVRGLMQGTADALLLIKGVGVCLVMLAIFAPLSIIMYLNKNNR